MASWEEILGETQAAGSTHDVIRRRYLRRLGRLTKRNVIAYYSGWLQKQDLLKDHADMLSIGDGDKNGFMSVIHKMDRTKGLDLVLHTPGGDMAATESIVDYLRAMFKGDVRAVIPQLAMSGGTIMALACKQIVMGHHSSIGPIDPQYGTLSVAGFLQEFKQIRDEIKADPNAALLWQPILSQVQPGFITECENAIKWSHAMAARFLKENMFKDDPNIDAVVAEIIKRLVEPENTITHGRHIAVDEAREIFGDKIVALEVDEKMQDAVLSVHHAMMITLQATAAAKIIENHMGRAFVMQAQMQIVRA